jgi:hypothetical protein
MLSVEEALLFKAVQDEEKRQQAEQAATVLGGAGGAVIGAAAGTIPHKIGNAVNNLKDAAARTQGLTPAPSIRRTLKPGPRMAGGLTGLILGGGLGAGMAALMKRESDAGALLGKIQAQRGELDEQDTRVLAKLLGETYNNPSQLM